jgi:hypothetical protein
MGVSSVRAAASCVVSCPPRNPSASVSAVEQDRPICFENAQRGRHGLIGGLPRSENDLPSKLCTRSAEVAEKKKKEVLTKYNL